MLLYFLAQSSDMLYKLIKIILGEINAGFLILLNLLQNRFVVVLHLELRLIEILDAILVGLECTLHLVLGIEAVVHHLLHLLYRGVSLLLVQQRFLDFDFHLLRLMAQVHVLPFGLLVVCLVV